MKCQMTETPAGTWIYVPAGRGKVESISFEDGTCELFIDLPHDVLGALYTEAAEQQCSVDEIVADALEAMLRREKRKRRSEDEDLYNPERDW